MARITEVSKMLKILECIYSESKLDVQMSQKDYSEQFGLAIPTVNRLFSKLREEKIILTTGKSRSQKYRWIAEFKPTEALAIKLGAVKIKTNLVSEFADHELISELKKRGYLIFKEC